MFEDRAFEYRTRYHWGTHWTAINFSDTPVEVYQYLKENLAEMQDAMEEDPENYFSVEFYTYGDLEHTWEGTPEELMKAFKEIADEWLSHAFE
jgi:hypothetical protein